MVFIEFLPSVLSFPPPSTLFLLLERRSENNDLNKMGEVQRAKGKVEKKGQERERDLVLGSVLSDKTGMRARCLHIFLLIFSVLSFLFKIT